MEVNGKEEGAASRRIELLVNVCLKSSYLREEKMKTKKIAFVIALVSIVMALPLVVVPAAHAVVNVPSASITWIGVYPGVGNMVKLVDNSGTNWTGERQFFLSNNLGNAGYATALTAFSNNQTVWVRLADAAAGSLVFIIYINP